MSQSNYNIPNQSAPAVRAQLNSVFGSIATNNSGSAAPSTTFAHQWWYDTTTNILKQRNAANSAWIDIGTFDQTGGTFTPTGQRDLASEAEAEAGTDNTKLMTPLRLRNGLNATGSAPVYACRAWVNFDGTGTPAIRASGNVSSITDNGTGDYTVNFTTAMPDANYSIVGTCSGVVGNIGAENSVVGIHPTLDFPTASAFRVRLRAINTNIDGAYVCLSVFR